MSPGEWPVLRFPALVQSAEVAGLMDALRVRCGFTTEFFSGEVMPLLGAFGEVVQLLPAPGARFDRPGGLLALALGTAAAAVELRRGQILPRGAAPEAIGDLTHRWTFAVMMAGLMHFVPISLSRLRVVALRDGAEEVTWSPFGRSLPELGATRYRFELVSPVVQPGCVAHAISLVLASRSAPAAVLEWLAEDGPLLAELVSCLRSETSSGSGAIAELVRRASSRFGLAPHQTGEAEQVEIDLVATAADSDASSADPKVVSATASARVPADPEPCLEDLDCSRRHGRSGHPGASSSLGSALRNRSDVERVNGATRRRRE